MPAPESTSHHSCPVTERRRHPRIALSLDVATPVVLSGEGFQVRGLARNISEDGVLVEVPHAPPIGARVEVTFEAVPGSQQAGQSVALFGEVRHQVAWSFIQRGRPRGLRGVGIRFLSGSTSKEAATSWIFRTDHIIH